MTPKQAAALKRGQQHDRKHIFVQKTKAEYDAPRPPTRLCHCGRVGFYAVGKKVFCEGHKAEAYARQAEVAAKERSHVWR